MLKNNKLSNAFLIALENTLMFDSYIKSFDLSHNRFGYEKMKKLIRNETLLENNSLLNFDLRFNPGTNDKI